jgi:hypothetical protein
MQVIVAGSRSISDPDIVAAAIAASGFVVSEIISGTARGADQLGECWAAAHGVPVARFPAQWERFGRSAGVRRNEQMVRHVAAADGGLVAVWDGVSRGTAHVIECARQHGLAVYVHRTGRNAQSDMVLAGRCDHGV